MPPPTDRATPGLRERKKARTRATIQTHALRLFHEQGYQATTIEQIIDAAEVSETTFFRYFRTKEDVVLQDDLDPLIVEAFQKQPADLTPIQAIRAAIRQQFDALAPDQRQAIQERTSLILAERPLRAAMLDQISQAMLLLADAVAERTGRPKDDLAVRTVAGSAIGAMLATLPALAENPAADLPALIDQALGHLEAGLPV
ncbi:MULTISPECIES: TetR family transcriptional regulator [unclassified Pseudofrankia]|uniref:acyl-CoA-like ligand-binding transcription factor n=1 Tax=unclassified Pseudofrankia TaxID=2994372 RepID=UPI0008DAF351|nr:MULTISPECIES: TetR family transcriptional regulator [unclassified Pseudofrankia]MDT3445213.1 TetR family transcriptional regulator [Pseudofrankia sp. BMG5.37]OHV63314.1 TetR family transcriptional regulator [Pseudofrankia sp. BMG5.36]